MNKNQGKTLWDRTDKRGVFETRQRARVAACALGRNECRQRREPCVSILKPAHPKTAEG